MLNKRILFSILVLASMPTYGAWQTRCSTVDQVITWSVGSDRYGIRTKLENNPTGCSGFWVNHDGDNKSFVFATLLTAAASGAQVCIQYDLEQTQQDGYCRLNNVAFVAN